MAKINPVKLRQEAEKFERAGKIEQAISVYTQLAEDSPRDWNLINKIGDLYARLSRVKEASNHYAKVASHLTSDGFHLKAIAIWKKINKLDPAALEPYMNLADLYAKQGLTIDAKSQYQFVVEEQVKKGRAKEAIEVLRKLVDLDPADLKVRSRLADLHLRDGDPDRAAEELVGIAGELKAKNHVAEALAVIEKGLKMDPKSARLRLEMASLHLAQNNPDAASAMLEEARRTAPEDPVILRRLGEAYLHMGRVDEAESIIRRLLLVQPDDPETRGDFAQLLASRGRFDEAYDEAGPLVERLVDRREGAKAAAILEGLAAKNPNHVKTLVRLAEVYRQLHKEPAVAATYARLADAYIAAGATDQAVSVLELAVSREPANAAYQRRLAEIKARPDFGVVSKPKDASKAPGPTEDHEFSFGLAEEKPASAKGGVADAQPRPAIVPSRPLTEDDREFIDEHLSEGRVFRKYGLVDKAVAQFTAVLKRFPDNATARIELRDIFRDQGQSARAAEQSLALAEIARLSGDQAAAEAHDSDAGAAPPSVALEAPLASEEETPFVVSEDEVPLDEPVVAEPPNVDAPVLVEPLSAEAPSLAVESEPLVFEREAIESEAFQAPAVTEEPMPLDLGVAIEAPSVPEEPLEADFALDHGAAEDDVLAPAIEDFAPPPPADTPEDLASLLAEVDSFVALGFVEDAREALYRAEQMHPGHPAIARKRAEAGLDPESAYEAPPPQPSTPGMPIAESVLDEVPSLAAEPAEHEWEGPLEAPEPSDPEIGAAMHGGEASIDLGSELNELFETHGVGPEAAAEVSPQLGEAGLAEIFREFRKGVDEQLGSEDYDTRYNLGIAYKEMGLVDEALAEFQLAAKDPRRTLECASMLGICFLEKGLPKQAIQWFEKGLAVGGRGQEEYRGLSYDLATAYEADDDKTKALQILSTLHAEDATFRDVAERIRRLRK